MRFPDRIHEDVGIDERSYVRQATAFSIRAMVLRLCSSQSGSTPGPSPRIALLKEPLQVLPRLETLGALPRLQPVTSRRPQPRAERQPFPARLTHESITVIVRNNQLNPCHTNAPRVHPGVCIEHTHPRGLSPTSPTSCMRVIVTLSLESRDQPKAALPMLSQMLQGPKSTTCVACNAPTSKPTVFQWKDAMARLGVSCVIG